MTRSRALAALVAALALLLCGCAPAPSTRLHSVDPADVPLQLLSPMPSQSVSQQPNGVLTKIYLVSSDTLRAVTRRVSAFDEPSDAIHELLAGPSSAEAAAGLTSDIPTGTWLRSVGVAGGVATIDLSQQFGDLGGAAQVLAVAQLVCTVTELSPASAVRFAVAGTPIEVPDGTGSLSFSPRTRSDYAQLLR